MGSWASFFFFVVICFFGFGLMFGVEYIEVPPTPTPASEACNGQSVNIQSSPTAVPPTPTPVPPTPTAEPAVNPISFQSAASNPPTTGNQSSGFDMGYLSIPILSISGSAAYWMVSKSKAQQNNAEARLVAEQRRMMQLRIAAYNKNRNQWNSGK